MRINSYELSRISHAWEIGRVGGFFLASVIIEQAYSKRHGAWCEIKAAINCRTPKDTRRVVILERHGDAPQSKIYQSGNKLPHSERYQSGERLAALRKMCQYFASRLRRYSITSRSPRRVARRMGDSPFSFRTESGEPYSTRVLTSSRFLPGARIA